MGSSTRMNAGTQDPIVVVGTSAGGLEALTKLVAQLPEDFPAAVFIVQHMSAEATGDVLLRTLNRHGKLECVRANNGEQFQSGRIYLAPSDHHIMLARGKILVTKGAQENRSRPAIDPLFRSAAVVYGNQVIGVLLTGYLDDGTAGMIAIRRCGGTCVVQDPDDAAYPDMPKNALRQLQADHCLPLAQMGALLTKLVKRKPPAGSNKAVPKDLQIEATIAERVLSDLDSVNALGEQVPFNCPGCGGVLWMVGKGKSLRYRCHTGHAYTAAVLMAEQTEKIEETLWVALRMFEERRNLLTTMAVSASGTNRHTVTERVKQSEIHIQRIRAMLLASGDGNADVDMQKKSRKS